MNRRLLVPIIAILAVVGAAAVVLSPHHAAAKPKADPAAVHATSTPSPSAAPAAELPPECTETEIVNNSGQGPAMYVIWCGTGSAGEAPVMTRAKTLIVNGTVLRPVDCTKANPCHVVWPGSPPS